MAVPICSVATRSDVNDGPPIVSTYREFDPDPALRSAVGCTWEGEAGWSRPLRVLPDGCVDVVWSGSKVRVVRPSPVVTCHQLDSHTYTLGVRLRPGWGATVLGVPIRALSEVTDLDGIWSSPTVRTLEAMLAQAAPGQGRHLLAAAIDQRLTVTGRPDPTVLGALVLLDQALLSVGAVSDNVGLSDRHLRRLFDDHVGLTPKSFQTIARFQRFRRHVTSPYRGITMARAAVDCGYADQAHLAHDCLRLARATPTSLLQRGR